MRGQMGTYVYMQISRYWNFHDGRTVKSALRNTIHKTVKQKPTSNKLEEKICFILKMYYFCNNLIDQSKRRLINYYL